MAGPYDYYGQDEQLQRYTGETQKGVSSAMMEGGGPLRRAWAGAMAWKQERQKSPWLDKQTAVKQDRVSRGLSRLLRLTGRTKQAEWIDRFTATQIKKPREEEKKERDIAREAKKATADSKREMTTVKGSLIRIEANIGILSAAVMDTKDDVTDIKKMLMPTNLVAEGTGDKYGEQQFMQYNPLAPKGAQFLKQQTLEIEGEPVRGKLINRAPDEEFMQSAIRMAAVETASTILRIQRKDEEKKTRLERRRMNLANDTWAYSDPTEPDRDFFRKLTDEWGGKAEEVQQEDSLAEDMMEGIIGGAIGATAPGIFKGILTKLLGTGAGSILAPALAAAVPLAIMGAFTRWAETADINNPGRNPLALIGYWGLKWSEIMRGETVEEQRSRREAFENDLMEQARRGEIPLSVAQGSQGQGRRAPGAFTPWNMPQSAAPSQDMIDLYSREARKFREMAANETDEEKRRQMEAAAATFESLIPAPEPTGELRPVATPENMKDLITQAANEVGMDAATMIGIARQESGFDPNARPYDSRTGEPLSSARGLFQFISSTWNAMRGRYGGDFSALDKGPMDPYANALAASLLAKEHSEALQARGIEPTPRNLYALHMLGEKKGQQLLNADPNATAAELFPAEAATNVGMFYDGNRPVTVQELLDKMYERVGARYYSDRYQLEQRFGRNYQNAFITPQRFNGNEMDATSREVMVSQRTESRGTPAASGGVAIVNNTLPVRGTPPVTTAPRPPGYTSDPSILTASGRDS